MNLENYELVWSDEFDYEGMLDETKWTYEDGNHQWPNKELQAYTKSLDNVFVKDGKLTIRSIKQQDGEREYTSGKVNTKGKGEWQYGYFEVKAKLPVGLGSWPAIWLMPAFEDREIPDGLPKTRDGRLNYMEMTKEQWKLLPKLPKERHWPECGEIDMLEHIGRKKDWVLFSLHSGKYNHRQEEPNPYSRGVQLEEGFDEKEHIFGMEWTKEYFEFFIDGKSLMKFERVDDDHHGWPFDKPFYLIFNTAVGGGLGGPVDDDALPYLYEIEYVRVYQKKND